MRNYELIKAVYDRCPDARDHSFTVDQYFDRCQDIIDLIERERPEIKSEINSVDAKEIERHVGLEIGPDGTVNSIIGNNYSGLD
jgi:hypothetical protein